MDCISVVFRLLVLHTYFRSYSTYIVMQLFQDVQIIANCTWLCFQHWRTYSWR